MSGCSSNHRNVSLNGAIDVILTIFDQFANNGLHNFNHFTKWSIAGHGSWRQIHNLGARNGIRVGARPFAIGLLVADNVHVLDDTIVQNNGVGHWNVKILMYIHEVALAEDGRGQQLIEFDDFLRKTIDNELLGLLYEGVLIILYLSRQQTTKGCWMLCKWLRVHFKLTLVIVSVGILVLKLLKFGGKCC